MEKTDILLFKYIRGSQLYGTNTPESDTDTGTVYIDTVDNLLTKKASTDHKIGKGDDCEYEIGRFLELLSLSNPNVLEALFVPDEFVEYCHPSFKVLREKRDEFLSKRCFSTLVGFAISQIRKSYGLNKKINKPMKTKPSMYDYMYVADKQGSVPLRHYIEKRFLNIKWDGTNQKEIDEEVDKVLGKIGVNKIPNMDSLYGAYIGEAYNGFITPEGHQIKFSNISCVYERPVFYFSYNMEGYSTACKEYKEYNIWVKERNPERYADNIKNNSNYDKKNMLHTLRLLNMGIELAEGKGLVFNRRGIDNEYLLSIRKGDLSRDEIMEIVNKKKEYFESIIDKSTLPEEPNTKLIDEIHLRIRKEIYNL